MRAAILDGATVINIIAIDGDTDLARFNAVLCGDDVANGWTYEAGVFTPPAADLPDEAEPVESPVPYSVSNYQARAVMRTLPMPDGRSLFTTVDTDLRAAVQATQDLAEFDEPRVAADLAWQAWEQANTYERHGQITTMLAARYDFDAARTDALFRQAETVRA